MAQRGRINNSSSLQGDPSSYPTSQSSQGISNLSMDGRPIHAMYHQEPIQNPSVDSAQSPNWSGAIFTPDTDTGTYHPLPESPQILLSHSNPLLSSSWWDQSQPQPWSAVGIATPTGASSFSRSLPAADNHFWGSTYYTTSEVGGTPSSQHDSGHRGFASDSHSVSGGGYQTHLPAVPEIYEHTRCPQPTKHDNRGETRHHSIGSQILSQESGISQGNRYKGPPPPCPSPNCLYKARTFSQLRKHRLAHERPFKCAVAECTRREGFTTKNDLERHKRSVHTELPPSGFAKGYICAASECKSGTKIWPRRDNFKAHVSTMHAIDDDAQLNDLIKRSEHIITRELLSQRGIPTSFTSEVPTEPAAVWTKYQTQESEMVFDMDELVTSPSQGGAPSTTGTSDVYGYSSNSNALAGLGLRGDDQWIGLASEAQNGPALFAVTDTSNPFRDSMNADHPWDQGEATFPQPLRWGESHEGMQRVDFDRMDYEL